MRPSMLKRLVVFSIKRHKLSAGALILLLTGITLIIMVVLITLHFRPIVMELALSEASDNITIAVNEAVSEIMLTGNIDYSNLVTLEKDSNGNITALSTNIANINLLQTKITNSVEAYFADSGITSVKVPVGNLIGGALLSGRGPLIKVDLLSVTNVNTSFRNEFISAGINQTRHRILMDVEVTFGILLAGLGEWSTVVTEVSVAETVIVGNVPSSYATIE